MVSVNAQEMRIDLLRTSRSAKAADRAAVLLLLDYQSQVGVQTTFDEYENGPLRPRGGMRSCVLRGFSSLWAFCMCMCFF